MTDNVVEIKVKSRNDTKAGLDDAKRDAEDAGDDAGRSFGERFSSAMGGIFSRIGGGGDAEKSGGEAGGFFSNAFTRTVVGGKWATIIGGAIAPALAMLPALGAVGAVGLVGALAVGIASKIPSVGKQIDGLGKTVMSTLESAVRPIVPVIKGVLSQVSGFVKSMGPLFSQAFLAVAPAMMPLTHGLEQLLANIFPGLIALLHAAMPAVTAFAGALSGLGSDIGGMFAAFAPAVKASAAVMKALFGVIGGLLPVIAKLAGTMAGLLAPVIAQLAGLFRGLGPVIAIIARVVGEFAKALLENLAGGLKAIIGLVRAVEPALMILAKALGQVFRLMENRGVFNDIEDAVEALVPVLAKMISELITGLVPILPTLVTLLADAAKILQAGLISAVTALSAVLVPLIPVITAVATVIANVLAAGLEAVVPLLVKLAPFILAIVAAVKLWSIAQAALDVVMDANPIGLLVIAIIGLIGAVVELVKHWHDVEQVAATVWHAVLAAVRDVWNWVKSNWPLLLGIFLGPFAELVGIVIKFHKQILAIIKGAWSVIKAVFVDAWHFIEDVFRDAWGWIMDLVRREVQGIETILSWFGKLGSLFRGWWDDAVNAVKTAVGTMMSFVRSIPGRIMAALAALPGELFSFGAHIISMLARGITSAIGDVTGAMVGIGSEILHHIPHSPAQKGPLSGSGDPTLAGRKIAQMLSQGMTSGLPAVSAAAARMAGAAGVGGHSYAAVGGGSGGVIRLEVAGSGSGLDELFVTWLKEKIRVKGGGGVYSVQRALGSTWPRGA